MSIARAALAAAVLLALAAAPWVSSGCAASKACNLDPWSCAAGTTCWFDDENGTSLSCLASGTGAVGDTCFNTAEQPTCGDGLMCLQLQPDEAGVCVLYCEATGTAHRCASPAVCDAVMTLGDQPLSVCRSPGASGGGGGGGGDAGSH